VPSAKAANGAAKMELDASLNNCRRLNEIWFLITYPLTTSLSGIGAASKHIHSTVALKYITIDKARDMVTINQS